MSLLEWMVLFLAIIALAIAIEVAARKIWHKWDGQRGSGLVHQIRRDWIKDIPEDRQGPLEPNAYGLYWNRKWIRSADGSYQTNNLGYREGWRETVLPAPQGVERVLVLGSSTTYSDFACQNFADSWPKVLERMLLADVDGNQGQLEVINAGLNYALSTELLTHYCLVGRHVNPMVVVVEGPGNDWLPVISNDKTLDYAETRGPGRTQVPRFGEAFLIRHTYILRVVLALWLKASETTGIVQLEAGRIDWQNQSELMNLILRSNFDGLRRNLETLIMLCASENRQVVFVPFITASSTYLQRSRPERREFVPAQVVAIEKQNQIMRELAQKHTRTVTFVEGRPDIPDEFFVDGVHLTAEGEILKAEWVLRTVEFSLQRARRYEPER